MFPLQHGLVYPTTQGTLLQKYLETLIARLSPGEESVSKSHSLSSMKDFIAGGVSYTSPGASIALRRSSQAIPPSHQHSDSKPSPDSSSTLEDDTTDADESEL